MESDNRV